MTPSEKILNLIQEKQIIRSCDLREVNVPREYLQRLYETGRVERIGRGLYALPDSLQSSNVSLAEVGLRVPKGVICLVSALHFYGITTQLPFEIWIAIEGRSWKPQVDYPPLNVFRFSGKAFHYGITVQKINEIPVRIYSIEKTVADCFKFRNTIGLDVAIEALKESLRDKRTTIDAIWEAAKVCRVHNIMRPYLEML